MLQSQSGARAPPCTMLPVHFTVLVMLVISAQDSVELEFNCCVAGNSECCVPCILSWFDYVLYLCLFKQYSHYFHYVMAVSRGNLDSL